MENVTKLISENPDEKFQTLEKNKKQASIYKLISAEEILQTDYPPLNSIVEDLLVEGLTIIGGRPKVGKSAFCLNLGLSVATGLKALDYFNVRKSEVIYFALEDGGRRIKDRLVKILGHRKENITMNNFHFLEKNQDFLKLNNGGISQLQILLKDYPDAKLIFIDTLGRSRADQGRRDNNIYMADYDLLAELQQFAIKNGICVVLVHHTKKGQEENVFDEISGTTGITGAADSLIVIKKIREERIMYVTGRDIAEAEYNLEFDEETLTWGIIPEEEQDGLTPERQEILSLLASEKRPMKTGQIAVALKKEVSTVSHLIKKLLKDKKVVRPKTGYYQLPPAKEVKPPNTDTLQSTQSVQSD